MNIYETVLAWLFASDFIWATIVLIWMIVGFPIAYLVQRKRDKK